MILTDKFKDMANLICAENHFTDKKTHDIIFNSIKKQYYKCTPEEKKAIEKDLYDWGKNTPQPNK